MDDGSGSQMWCCLEYLHAITVRHLVLFWGMKKMKRKWKHDILRDYIGLPYAPMSNSEASQSWGVVLWTAGTACPP